MLHALFSSDWHFDGLKNHFPDNHAALVKAEVRKTYLYAVENGIPYVIAPGDIADSSRMTAASHKALLSILVEFDDLVTTIYLKGNHDHGDVNSTSLDLFEDFAEYKLLKNFVVIKQPTVMKLGGVYVNFCPFPYEDLLPTKKPAVIVIHKTVQGVTTDNGRPAIVRKDSKFPAGSTVVSGHEHKHQIVFCNKVPVIYPGNVYQKNFGEKLPKGFIEMRAKYSGDKLKTKYEFVETIPNFRMVTLTIDKQEDFSKLEKDSMIRYRLYLGPGIVAPSSLRKTYPNIDQVWESGKRSKAGVTASSLEDIRELSKEIPKVDHTYGLKDFVKAKGKGKKTYDAVSALVETAVEKIFSRHTS
jgi:DNA repair exonuclease SbcCD nuclease subunit